MKTLHGEATVVVAASIDECLDLLEAIDHYTDWYPEVIRQVEVLERNPEGNPRMARATVHVARGPLVRDLQLVVAVTTDDEGVVKLTRLPNEPSDDETFEVSWHLTEADGTRIELRLHGYLDVPRLIPLGGIGDSMAEGFVAAVTRALVASRDDDHLE
jgi:Polyketide cyclase / dehydrase and lipid transport